MSFAGGGWGHGKWGSTLIWGYQSVGVAADAIRITDAMQAALRQSIPAEIKINAVIEIDGIDVTKFCSPFRLTLRGEGGASDAEFDILDPSVAASLHQSVVSITVVYTAPDGTKFESERFRGKAHQIETAQATTGSIRHVTCYDLGYSMSEGAPKTSSNYYFVTASSLIASELAAYGFGPVVGDFKDFTLALPPTIPERSRDFVNMLVSGLGVATSFWGADGILRVRGVTETAPGLFLFPRTIQTSQTPIEGATDRYNQVISAGADKFQYNDTADQAAKGIVSTTIQPLGFIYDYNAADIAAFQLAYPLYSAVYNTTAQYTRAKSICQWSLKNRYKWSSPLHAFVFPGDNVTLTLSNDSTVVARVTEVSDFGGWPDAWRSEFQGRAVA